MYIAKRIIDVLLSLIGIIILIPLTGIIGIFIKLDSRGPVFFLADRVGKDMKNFKMYKFRTMINTPICVGDSVCPQYDPRVTTFGRFLRRTKMNELPQLINILRGDMTFVGPRPESPDLAELYPEEAKRIFSVTPGLVSPATILGRNEEELYPLGVDAKRYYIEKILPKKVEIDLEYITNPTLFKDYQYILLGVKETLVGALRKKHIHDNRSQIYLLIVDILLIIGSYILAVVTYYGNFLSGEKLIKLFTILPIVTLIFLFSNIYFGIYTCLIRYISYHEIWGVFKGVTFGSFLFILFAWLNSLDDYLTMIALMNWAFLILSLTGLRVGLKFYWKKMNPETGIREKHRIFIFGANEAGISAYRAINLEKNTPFEVVGFIDDAPNKYGKKIYGMKVLGNRHHIKALAQLYKVEEILLAGLDNESKNLNKIIKICKKVGIKYRVFSSFKDRVSQIPNNFPDRSKKFIDMFPLERINIDHTAVKRVLAGKTVLIYGSGNALVMELCHQILELGCKKLIIVDRYESYLNELVLSLFKVSSKESIVPVLDDTDNADILEEIFEEYQPDIVFHASMRKYTPFLMLKIDNVGKANYQRTFNLAKIASKYKCELFVMISSLLAVHNGNSIGDTLRVAEVSLEHFFNDTNTRLIITRICDIIENRGGIVSVIEKQIREQQSVTLPSNDIQTCLMSKYSAAAFILKTLLEVTEKRSGRVVFTCKPSLRILSSEVASILADLNGLKLEVDLPIKYIDQSKEPSDLLIGDISPSVPIHYSNINLKSENAGFYTEELESVFKNFVLSDNKRLDLHDWKKQTRELIRLCGPDIFVSES